MAAVVEAHQPEFVYQATLILFGPGEVTRAEAMDEQNGLAMGLAIVVYGELQATAAADRVDGHGFSSTAFGCWVATSNASLQQLPEAAAKRRLEAVCCKAMLGLVRVKRIALLPSSSALNPWSLIHLFG
jgi:hypothetical protein